MTSVTMNLESNEYFQDSIFEEISGHELNALFDKLGI